MSSEVDEDLFSFLCGGSNNNSNPRPSQIIAPPSDEEEEEQPSDDGNLKLAPPSDDEEEHEILNPPSASGIHDFPQADEASHLRLPPGTTLEVTIYSSLLGIVLLDETDPYVSILYGKMVQSTIGHPIIAFTRQQDAGNDIRIGDILLSVCSDGEMAIECKQARQSRDVIRGMRRPITLSIYRLDDIEDVVSASNYHKVDYHSSHSVPSKQSSSYKAKYCAVGGIVSTPNVLAMFRSQEEYEIAALEVATGNRPTVKIKQFNLTGARIISNQRLVRFRFDKTPRKVFTLKLADGTFIQVMSETSAELKNVLDAVKNVIGG
jgi:hypothetical protein